MSSGGVVNGAGPIARKKIIFASINDKFGCILTQSLMVRKHGQSVTQPCVGHEFYGSVAKRSLQKSAKIIQKFTVRPRRSHNRHHPPNTPLSTCPLKWQLFCRFKCHRLCVYCILYSPASVALFLYARSEQKRTTVCLRAFT